MVGAFETAAFGMKPGETSEPVPTEFGYHIIRVTGVRPGKLKTWEQARPEIEAELKKQRAGKRYAEAADQFSDLVYEQSDSLKPAAEKFKLKISQASGWTSRESSPDEPLRNPKVLAALFSDDVLKNKRNTQAVEIAPGTVLSARVLEHKPAAKLPLEEVRAEVVKQIVNREARGPARKEGAARLAALKKGETTGVGFEGAKLVSRDKPEGLGPEAIEPVFHADGSKLPAYVGVEVPEGYVIHRISKLVNPPVTEEQQKNIQAQLARLNGAQEFRAFMAALRADTKVVINKELLQKKDQ